MRSVLRVAAFCAVFLFANEGLRYAHNQALRIWQPGAYTESSRLHYQDPCRIAILGDSIFLTGLDPAIIPDSYNFAWLDANYLANYLTLSWMLRANPERLEVLVLPLDRHSFAARRLDGPMGFHKASFADAFRADHHDAQRGRYIRMYIRDRFFPYADLPGFWADYQGADAPTFQKGFLAQTDNAVNDANGFARSAAKRGGQMFRGKAALDERLGGHFRAILDLAETNDLSVLLVQCPVTREFDDRLRMDVPDDEFDELKRSIVADYPGVNVLNVRDRFLDRHELFNDANHLNLAGAHEFSRLVRDKLRRLGHLAS